MELDINDFSKEDNPIECYMTQMAKQQAIEIDKNFWMIVKEKPKWMPNFIYRAVINNLVEFRYIKK